MMDRGRRGMAAFEEVYEEVGDLVASFVEPLPPEEREWVGLLDKLLRGEFLRWESAPHLRQYLERVERASRGSAWLGLIGRVYLHISYDMPRVLADSFGGEPTPRAWAEGLFHGMSAMFGVAFEKVLFRGSLGPTGRLAALIVPRFASDLACLATDAFVLRLRSQAWRNGRALAEDPARRIALEGILWDHVERESGVVMRLSRSARSWLRELRSPELAMYLAVDAPARTGNLERTVRSYLGRTSSR